MEKLMRKSDNISTSNSKGVSARILGQNNNYKNESQTFDKAVLARERREKFEKEKQLKLQGKLDKKMEKIEKIRDQENASMAFSPSQNPGIVFYSSKDEESEGVRTSGVKSQSKVRRCSSSSKKTSQIVIYIS